MSVPTVPAPALDRTPGLQKLGLRQYSGYAAGDAANNLAFSMAGSFLLLYYTNVVGLEAAPLGTMFLLIRFWDALADLGVGRAVDGKKPGGLGKFRPFILYFSLPLLLSSMAIFSAHTFFPDMSNGQALLYAYISYAVMGTLYSLVNIPYGSIAPAMTQIPTERARLATWRVYGSNITILMLAFVVAPQIKRFKGDPAGLQRSLFITTAIFVVLGMALYLYTVWTVKERVLRDVAAPSLRQSVSTLTHNKPLLWLCVGSLMFLSGLTALQTLAPYYALYVQKDAQYIAWNAVAQAAGTFLVAAFIPLIVRRVGKKNGYIALGIVGVAAGALLSLSPQGTPLVGVLAFAVMGVGLGGVNTLMWALEGDTVEYGEWKSGVPDRGHHVRFVLLHPQDGSGARWCVRRVRPGLDRIQLKGRGHRRPPAAQHRRRAPALVRPGRRRLHPHLSADHGVLSAHREGVPRDRRRDRGAPRHSRGTAVGRAARRDVTPAPRTPADSPR
jgi:glucuronide carrier protein